MRASIEAGEKSAYYSGRAETLEQNRAISSDAPDALERLREKLASLEKNQELMKACNKIIRDKKLSEAEKVEKMGLAGLAQKDAIELMQPGRFGGMGFASFSLTNNGATIRTTKERIEKLEKLQLCENKEKAYGDTTIIENAEENRVQIFFSGKPSDTIRTRLKQSGFRWTPSVGCWQAYYSNRSKWAAEDIVNPKTEN